jgi:murein L,D-transpeptidase YafK
MAIVSHRHAVRAAHSARVWMQGKKTIAERVEQFGPAARTRLRADFDRIACSYPPTGVVLVGIKDERCLEVWVTADATRSRASADASLPCIKFLRRYPILAASGGPGPKLREGDRQVPEGIYAVESLNPNSRFHLALRLDYPNAFDREMAAADGRANLGGDIMIHGSDVSIGCLAMGNEAAEDLFVLAGRRAFRMSASS